MNSEGQSACSKNSPFSTVFKCQTIEIPKKKLNNVKRKLAYKTPVITSEEGKEELQKDFLEKQRKEEEKENRKRKRIQSTIVKKENDLIKAAKKIEKKNLQEEKKKLQAQAKELQSKINSCSIKKIKKEKD